MFMKNLVIKQKHVNGWKNDAAEMYRYGKYEQKDCQTGTCNREKLRGI